jgi:hypothetical protein
MSWQLIFLSAFVVLIGSILLKRRRAALIAHQQQEPADGTGRGRATGPVAQTSDTGGSFRNSKTAPVPAKSTPLPVVESVSVVLRRQVPVRWEEPARSWIGGLPRMPESVEWPLGPTTDYPARGPTPLHFVAQIACADLPPDLWGGLGPREGWLLLFLNGQDWDVTENSAAVRVLHIAEPGPERAPPPGIHPVHDEVYTGPDYGFVRTQEDIPTVWRRWPVDLVTIPNRVIEGAQTPAIIPQNFASILYDGAPVQDEGRVEPPWKAPFTWRGALYVVDSIARVLAKEHTLRLGNIREKLSAPGWIADAINRTDAQLARWLASPALQPTAENASSEVKARLETARPIILDKIEKLRAARQLLADSADAATLLARMDQTHRDYAAWRDSAKQRVAALRERIVAHDLDTPIAAEDWDVRCARFWKTTGNPIGGRSTTPVTACCRSGSTNRCSATPATGSMQRRCSLRPTTTSPANCGTSCRMSWSRSWSRAGARSIQTGRTAWADCMTESSRKRAKARRARCCCSRSPRTTPCTGSGAMPAPTTSSSTRIDWRRAISASSTPPSRITEESGHEGHRPVQPIARLLHGTIDLSTCDASYEHRSSGLMMPFWHRPGLHE